MRHSASPSFHPADARGVAFVVLNAYQQEGTFIAPLLDRCSSEGRLSPQDRSLASELAHGVVRRQATLDALLAGCVSRPRERVEPELWTLLRLGAYQLALLSSIPPHAAVHETVEVAARYGKRQWTGLLNGALRALGRSISGEAADFAAADAVPLADGTFRKLAQPVFPDPAADFSGYVSRAFSYPEWLIGRWMQRFDPPEVERLAFWFNTPSTAFLRVNRLRQSREQALEDLLAAGMAASPGALPESIRLDDRARVDALGGLAGGEFSVQDESAMFAVDLLDPQPGETVLDLCAAPGTKTAHLAERMRNTGRIVASDVAAARLPRIAENCKRLGISIVEPVLIARDGSDLHAGPYDAILVDVPCSNTGVLGKRPEARWRLTPNDLDELPPLQEQLLILACERLKPGGRIVYSTCSIEPEENGDVVRRVLEGRYGLRLVEERPHIPGRPADGGYQALLR